MKYYLFTIFQISRNLFHRNKYGNFLVDISGRSYKRGTLTFVNNILENNTAKTGILLRTKGTLYGQNITNNIFDNPEAVYDVELASQPKNNPVNVSRNYWGVSSIDGPYKR